MFHDIIRVYADAMYVATTLRTLPPGQPARENERIADGEGHGLASSLSCLAARIAGWLRTRLGRGFAASA